MNINNLNSLKKGDLVNIFEINNNKLFLRARKSKPITINIPFSLDEDIAKISAMILDGSISKNYCNIVFCQKKDENKVKEFAHIIKKVFGLESTFRVFANNSPGLAVNSKVLGVFLNKCVGIHKSDEVARIPFWIWNSPKPVIIEYLRYAFAMEGSISHYLKATEIKFHSVESLYLKDLKKLLSETFYINSNIQKYYIKEYGWKYYLSISNKEGIIRFQEIGFALDSHQARLNELIGSFKNKAWEITLVIISKNYGKDTFILSELCRIIPSICKRAIHHRLSELVKLGYLQKLEIGYILTDIGHNMAMTIQNNVKFTDLRTNPKQNEQKVYQFLSSKVESYRNEIARELKITPNTIRDTLKRLVKQQKIQLFRVDKFQRKFYSLKSN